MRNMILLMLVLVTASCASKNYQQKSPKRGVSSSETQRTLFILEGFPNFQKLVIFSSNSSGDIQAFNKTDYFAEVNFDYDEPAVKVSLPKEVFMEIVMFSEDIKRLSSRGTGFIDTKINNENSSCNKSFDAYPISKKVYFSKNGSSGGELLLVQEIDCNRQDLTRINRDHIRDKVVYIEGLFDGILYSTEN